MNGCKQDQTDTPLTGVGDVEEWLDLPNTVGPYQVSSLGRVRRYLKTGRLKAVPVAVNRDGYARTRIRYIDRPRRVWRYLHGLIASVFCEGKAVGLLVRHLNGVKLDLRAANLAWGTPAQNSLDVKWHRGGHGIKLSVDQVRMIKASVGLGISRRNTAKTFGVHLQTVNKIVRGEIHYDVVSL